LLKRRSTPEPTPVEAPAEPARPGSKGRPTPKRNEAQASRRAAVQKAPTNRKEAARLRRDAARADRRSTMTAMATGDERNYPPAHAGKERALVRDVVDSRKSRAWIGVPGLLALLPLIVMSQYVKPLFTVVMVLELVLIGVVLSDSVTTYREVGRMLAERFPTGTKQSTRSLKFYGIQRNNVRPAKRRPPARVKTGDKI
jgi:hypothetical protein